MHTFDDVMRAFEKQTAYFIELIVSAYDLIDGAHAVHAPEPFVSALLDDCIERGLTRQEGGVRYNFSGIFGVGLASAADAMAAVKKVVFEDHSASLEELLSALKDDFAGEGELLAQCAEAPKFGNNNDYVDLIARNMGIYSVKKSFSIRACARILHPGATFRFNTRLFRRIDRSYAGRT